MRIEDMNEVLKEVEDFQKSKKLRKYLEGLI